MLESEVESLIPLVCGGVEIMQLLLVGHRIPSSVSLPVTIYVVGLRQKVDYDVTRQNPNESPISSAVEWCVVWPRLVIHEMDATDTSLTGTIDIGCDDASRLDEHVITCGGYGSRPYGVGVSRVPPHLDGMCYSNRTCQTSTCLREHSPGDLPFG